MGMGTEQYGDWNWNCAWSEDEMLMGFACPEGPFGRDGASSSQSSKAGIGKQIIVFKRY